MRTAQVPTDKLLEIREHLRKSASLEKKASDLERENSILHRTLALVADGQLDPAVAVEKVASFLEDEDSLRILELAVSGPSGFGKLGSVVDDDSMAPRSGETPEEKLREDVTDIVTGSGLSII